MVQALDHLDPSAASTALRRELVDTGYGYGDAEEHEQRRMKEYPMLSGELQVAQLRDGSSLLSPTRHRLP